MPDFGTDFDGVTDLNARCSTTSGRWLLAQALVRRLITPRGRLRNAPNYGTDITRWLNDDVNKRDVEVIKAETRAECLKDERVEDCTVSITSISGAYKISIRIEDADGPFDLVLALSTLNKDLSILSVS